MDEFAARFPRQQQQRFSGDEMKRREGAMGKMESAQTWQVRMLSNLAGIKTALATKLRVNTRNCPPIPVQFVYSETKSSYNGYS
jgi:hypothetical protein